MFDELRAVLEEDPALAKMAEGLVREFHRTLNTTSGVMAAGIVLSGGDLSKLSGPMSVALVSFVLALAVGLLFLHLLYRSVERFRVVRVHRELDRLLDRPVRLLDDPDTELQELLKTPRKPGVPLSVMATVARLAHIGLVAAGFGLVLWGLGREVLF